MSDKDFLGKVNSYLDHYCISQDSFWKAINNPKVIPMIRGHANEEGVAERIRELGHNCYHPKNCEDCDLIVEMICKDGSAS